jgi:hypothetical protein
MGPWRSKFALVRNTRPEHLRAGVAQNQGEFRSSSAMTEVLDGRPACEVRLARDQGFEFRRDSRLGRELLIASSGIYASERRCITSAAK